MGKLKLNKNEIMQQEARYIAKTFNRQEVVWERGEGCRLWDTEGKKYLDFFSGHAVMSLGYHHTAQITAMQAQLEKLAHTGNLYYLEQQVLLAQRLVETSFGDKVLFSNSGAEIVELAIKLARKWARRIRPQEDQYEIIAWKGSFHGRTYGALSATGQEKYHRGIGPMLPGFKHVTVNDFTATASAISNKTCAIMIEPIQGESGIHPVTKKYVEEIRGLCDRNHLLLIFDEIQCGLGRTGRVHAYEHFGVEPDVMLLGKALGGGLPISALVTRAEIASALEVGDHGTTFGGNPVAAAAGNVLLEEITKPELLEHVQKTGDYLGEQLQVLANAYPDLVTNVRGVGFMWGMELREKGPEAVRLALDKGLVINCTAGKVLRFLPALNVSNADVSEAMTIMRSVLQEINGSSEKKVKEGKK